MILADAARHISVAILRAVTKLALRYGDVTDMALLAQTTQGLVTHMQALRRLFGCQEDRQFHAASLLATNSFSRGGIQ